MMQPMKLGEVTISRVIEIDRSSFPTASMLPDSTAAEIAAHHQWLKPHFFDERIGDLASRIQTYVVPTPRPTILIHTALPQEQVAPGAHDVGAKAGGGVAGALRAAMLAEGHQ